MELFSTNSASTSLAPTNSFIAALILSIVLSSSFARAQEMEIEVPKGWTATESGIAKGNSELFLGPILDLGQLTPAEYLAKLAEQPSEDMEITSIKELNDGSIVVSIIREVLIKDSKARSILFICKKDGSNQHRLLELFSDNVITVVTGGKAAIAFCDQP